MRQGGDSFKSPSEQPGPSGQGVDITVLAPPINIGFLKDLMKMQGTHEVAIGRFPFIEYLEAILSKCPKQYTYKECLLARALRVKLRLTGNAP